MSKIRKIFKLTINNISYDLRDFILCIIILSTTLSLSVFSSMIYKGADYAFGTLEETLKQDVGNCGMIEIKPGDVYSYDSVDYMNRLYKELNLDSIGSYSFGVNSYLTELMNLQKKTLYNSLSESQKDYLEQGYIEVLFINPTLLNLCNLNLETPYKAYDSDKVSLYLGSSYKPFINKGTEFTSPESDLKYVVRGFLKEDSVWLNSSTINGFNTQDSDYRVPMDCAVICIDERPMSNVMFFSSSNAVDNNTIEKIIDISNESGVSISAQSLLDLYYGEKEDLLILLGYLRQLIFIVFLSSTILITTSQIVGIIGKKRVLGIYTVNGFSRGEISGSIVLEAVIRLLISLIISIILGRLVLLKWFGNASSMFMRDVFWSSSVPDVIAVSLALTAVSTVISLIVMRRYTPIELLGEKND